MITSALINLAYALINGLVSILPDSTGFGTEVLSAANTIGGYFGMFSPIAPIGTLSIAVGLVFSVEIAIFGWKTVKSIVSHIPWFGGAGH